MTASDDDQTITPARVFHEGLYFGEAPRWHDGRLWYSDFYDHAVHAIDMAGNDERALEVENQPSGLGWLPDGTMLVVSMIDRKVLRWDGASLVEHADLTPHAGFHANDMVVSDSGQAFVGNFGFDYEAFLKGGGGAAPTTAICRVDPDGRVAVAAEEMAFPNGSVITADGSTLIVGETWGARLTAFDLASDGGLSNRRVWADLSAARVTPDGCCLDAEGAIWVANPLANRCARVAEGGEILETVETSLPTFACMLGGPAGRHLFVMTAPDSMSGPASSARNGRIEVAEVGVPHAGLP